MRRAICLAILSACFALAACASGQAIHDPHAALASAQPQPPMTHQEASLQCWMQYEHGRATISLDRRADLVDQCVKAKMNRMAVK